MVGSLASSTPRLSSDKAKRLKKQYYAVRKERNRQRLAKVLSKWRVNVRVQQFLRMEDAARQWLHA